jgi:two-component system, OmpR family, response regulator
MIEMTGLYQEQISPSVCTMNGIETLNEIKTNNADIPVTMLSAQYKIEVAISCMHQKAYDYVVKSETAFTRLQKNNPTIFKYKQREKEPNWYVAIMEPALNVIR